LPRFADFETGGAYYATAAHELTHWTGHPDRCARDLSGRFGTASYAAEELVAEIGAAFAMARLGLDAEPRADHAHYIASWIQLLRGDDRAIFTAAAKAEQATKFLFGETAAETAAA
jgi:antirestriction protein ArdC